MRLSQFAPALAKPVLTLVQHAILPLPQLQDAIAARLAGSLPAEQVRLLNLAYYGLQHSSLDPCARLVRSDSPDDHNVLACSTRGAAAR